VSGGTRNRNNIQSSLRLTRRTAYIAFPSVPSSPEQNTFCDFETVSAHVNRGSNANDSAGPIFTRLKSLWAGSSR
jgi:hypothetical protein